MTVLPHLRKLGGQAAVYGSADVIASLINFLLLPVYSAYLGIADVGDLALLLLFGVMAKIVSRLGLDAGFFRVHYDLPDAPERRRLAGTVALFAAGAGASMLALTALLSAPLTAALLGPGKPALWVVLVAADVFLSGLGFVPAALLRIEDRPGLFSAASVLRHLSNTALKVALLAGGQGVTGVLCSDALASALYAAALLPVLRGRASLAFAPHLLRQALGFGLPKVPHGLLVQVQNVADRKILDFFVTRAEVGLYQVGYSFGTMVKFPLSAFEPAWQPFVYSRLTEADAPATLARVARYAFAVFVAAGLAVAVCGRELLVLMTPRNPAYHAAAPVIPVVALAYVLHGAFLLTSVGIGIRKEARYYPRITAAAAATNLLANLALVPRFGIQGAAWATVISYAVMAGLGCAIAQRLYPLPLEWGRMAQAAGLAGLTYAASLFAPEPLWPALAVKGALLAGYPALLVAAGFLREGPGYSETTSSGRTT